MGKEKFRESTAASSPLRGNAYALRTLVVVAFRLCEYEVNVVSRATNVEFDRDINTGTGKNIEEPKEREHEADFEEDEVRGSSGEVNVPHVEEVANVEAHVSGLGREEADDAEINVADCYAP
ncbi:hypothetical protein RND71_036944 [Anisodus tanguticus]|uniref:Uncharacterized protein n=1 Tax=Anisodus tanguticus TaxID=243964 RepID=A0AAE1R1X6_9SOLA|nr:hypothetical protein RND71_036944 [Anisodus tanguticus]